MGPCTPSSETRAAGQQAAQEEGRRGQGVSRMALICGPAGLQIGSHGGEMGGTFAATWLTSCPSPCQHRPKRTGAEGRGRQTRATSAKPHQWAAHWRRSRASGGGEQNCPARTRRRPGQPRTPASGPPSPRSRDSQIGQHAGQAKRTDGPMSEVHLAINSPVASNSILKICGDRVDDPWQQLVAPASQRQWGRHGKVDLTWRRSPRGRSARGQTVLAAPSVVRTRLDVCNTTAEHVRTDTT